MKRIVIILIMLSLLSGGAKLAYHHFHTPKPIVVPVQPIPTKPVPVKSEATSVPEPVVTSGYVVAVVSLSKSVNGESIKLQVTNDGDTTLQLIPNDQFKLVGVDDQKVHPPLPEKTTPDFQGTLAPNAVLSGIVTFDSFNDEASELRFYPDTAAQTYIVVPLIPLPEGQ